MIRPDSHVSDAAERAHAPAGVRAVLTGAGRWLGDLVMPPVCLSCHEPLDCHDHVCPSCWAGIDFIRPPLCDRLGIPLPFDAGGPMVSAAAAAAEPVYDRARAVARYAGTMRKLIHDYKYRDRHDARRLFVGWLSVAGDELLLEADALLPVPLHRVRLLTRRFNQSALLARELARLRGLPYWPDTLRRIRRTKPQVGLSMRERRDNLQGAFRLGRSAAARVAGRRLVLVDDVITTGATADACARVLKKAGAASVDILALAIVDEHARMTT